jgi:fatty acid desaturase
MGEPDVAAFVREHDLTRKSALQTNTRAAVNVGCYIALTLLGFTLHQWLAWAIIWLAQSVILVGAFSALHEAAHGNLYRSKRANRIAGVLWANLVLMNFSLYRAFHYQHHRFTRRDGDSEPETKIESLSQYALSMFALLFFADMWLKSISALTRNDYPWYCNGERLRQDVRLDALVFHLCNLALVALAIWQFKTLLFVWGIPILITDTVLMSITSLPEHFGCRWGGNYYETTRTVGSNPVFRFLYWNNNFHTEHHLHPSVPYQSLPKLHRFVADHLLFYTPSYLGWHASLIRELWARRSASRRAPEV